MARSASRPSRLDEEGDELVVGDGLELDHLAARDDGRQHALERVGHEDEVDVFGRLFEALEERVGGLDVHALGLDDHPDAVGRGERPESEVGDELGDLFDADELALALDHDEVGVHAAGEALALGAVPAAAAGGHQRGAELDGEAPLAEALGTGQQIGVARAARQSAGDVGLGARLSGDVSEHAGLGRRAARLRRTTTAPAAPPGRPAWRVRPGRRPGRPASSPSSATMRSG